MKEILYYEIELAGEIGKLDGLRKLLKSKTNFGDMAIIVSDMKGIERQIQYYKEELKRKEEVKDYD